MGCIQMVFHSKLYGLETTKIILNLFNVRLMRMESESSNMHLSKQLWSSLFCLIVVKEMKMR